MLTTLGRLVETAILSSLKADFTDVYFWHQKDKEVDFIARAPQGLLPIKVKFQSSLKKSDLNHLFTFMQKNSLTRGILISRTQIELLRKDERCVTILPAWFL